MDGFWMHAGIILGYTGVVLLCLSGMILSGLSFSGTWLVVLASALAAWVSRNGFPGWKTVVFFILLAAAAEVIDTLAGSWGVKRRGGSNLAGLAALAGGILGMVAGSFFPPPILAPLLGMLAGCFLGAYGVERARAKNEADAAHIARGAVAARVLMLCIKLGLTLAMILFLFLGMLFS